ncbi:MAG: YkgJ family cysteine cluster protein [Acetatifactor sp.]
MKRNVSLEEISDGRLYGINDMVKADCHGCKGCSACCHGMGTSVILDPCDLYRLQAGLGRNLTQLLQEEKLELNVVDGCILPNLKMAGKREACAFIDPAGRCGIHESRPGICRLFPLGRYYEDGDFRYFLQVGECKEKNRSKVKVSKWIDTPDWKRNHDFVCAWHELLKALERETAGQEDSQRAKALNLGLLNTFYIAEYDTQEDFYGQFFERLDCYREQFCI